MIETQTTNATSSYKLFCSAEWHLSRLVPRYAAPLYSYALHLSKDTGRFSLSLNEMAAYFGCDYKSISKAARALEKLGFFKRLRAEAGKPVSYQPVPHRKWAESHTNLCLEKIDMPWQNEIVDKLVKRLYAASDGNLKLWPNYVVGLRRLGLSDDEIVAQWEAFYLKDNPTGESWRGVYGRFHRHLKDFSKGRF